MSLHTFTTLRLCRESAGVTTDITADPTLVRSASKSVQLTLEASRGEYAVSEAGLRQHRVRADECERFMRRDAESVLGA